LKRQNSTTKGNKRNSESIEVVYSEDDKDYKEANTTCDIETIGRGATTITTTRQLTISITAYMYLAYYSWEIRKQKYRIFAMNKAGVRDVVRFEAVTL
jgi:hypothetical protein